MSDKNDNHYEGALLEDMNHKFDVILEYLAPLAPLSRDVAQLKDDMTEVKSRLINVEAAVTKLSVKTT